MTWQPIDGWNGRYLVSETGEVKRGSGQLLKQWLSDQGYSLVRLSNPRTVARVHRLVAAAFVSNPDNKPNVNHINNNRSDNRRENLEWCTQLENLQHARNQGRMPDNYWTGKRSPNAKITDEQADKIRAEYRAGGISFANLGKAYGLSKRSIGRIVNGDSYV